MAPQFKEGWQRKVLFHAKDIEKWSEAYRRQNEEDKQSKDFRKTEQEAPARRAIRSAMIDRRNHVDGHNRAYLDVNILLMDQREERARKVKEIGFLMSEAYEGTPRAEDIALQSPAFKGKLPIDGVNRDASDIRDAVRKTMQK
jgi:hypothetical protein